MKRLLAITAAVVTSAGVALLAVWPDDSTASAQALAVERAVAASIQQWPAPGTCVLMEGVVPESDAGSRQRPWEVCSRLGAVESPDAGAYYQGRVEIECRQAARLLCGLDGLDAGADAIDPRVRQQCSQDVQDQCHAAARTIGVAQGWMSEPYPWVAQPALRQVNRPGAIWRAHGCVCRATAGGACKYWPEGADAGVPVPTGAVVRALTVSGSGCIDTPCVETELRETLGPQMAVECR